MRSWFKMAAVSTPPLSVSVVEDHNDALPVIYRAIGSRKLPFSGNTLVHFDAHPDLLSPELPAREFRDKEKLFEAASIAEWILPAVYMGHIGCVVWVKPPWSHQMRGGEYSLVVGREKTNSGRVRVATPLDYFISGELYAHSDTLADLTSVPLHVLTLPVWQDHTHTSPPHLLTEAQRVLTTLLSTTGQPWLLDIDLDFFSTANPFRRNFSQEEYSFLEKLYKFHEPLNGSEACVSESVRRRREQVESLGLLWTSADHTHHVQPFTDSKQELVSDIKAKVGTVYDEEPFSAEDIHVAGLTSDLPHHISTESEMTGLMSSLSHLLHSLFTSSPPTLVTIARSTDDGYTPSQQVDKLQDRVLGVINRLCDNRVDYKY